MSSLPAILLQLKASPSNCVAGDGGCGGCSEVCLRERTLYTFKSHLDYRRPMGPVSGADSAAPRLNLYLLLFLQHHVPRGARGDGARERGER